ncbi:alpha/beta hydrolase [Paenibacillus glucanolyticus]|jgi:enterochelin esterase-like enzyme|uniref:Esterase n=1 Tax=Paenibacillus glucanolyticus TaxID=59843 RepID=A0A163FY35_9BACL|nr:MULTISPECIES: alpha/beta hydrolase-fold protein [Paenibacillus]MCA4756906.1 alpha/beta hydrolase [Mycolicibacterium fortuitum]ANA79220.1 esterase [Paenibacillus glucanolyticus]AVV56851.1 alpha/beta hydrolase [Paenibacillus glucanolyticus]ETT34036.1 putative esterase [Paenibacillus sp. FSL R5-808]KZS44625.1 esterase [Paenibacillus glucanolyticus]
MVSMSSRMVEIADFPSVNLGNTRSLYVYLPPSYHVNTEKRYAVLYMHDGQHVFSADVTGESWEMHETADRLVSEGRMEEIIIVGIATVPHQRLNEYFHDNPRMHEVTDPPFAGEQYEAFIIEEVMPYMNATFRTLQGPEYTAMMGSSAGGIVTYNIGFRRPEIFGSIAVMSPFFVKTEFDTEGQLQEYPFYQRYGTHPNLRIWLDMGGAEGVFMEKYARVEAERLIHDGFVPGEDLMLFLDPGAGHSQRDWAGRAQAPLLYFFGHIGEPASIQLHGDSVVGINGPLKQLNPVITYTSGFVQTLMNGTFHVEDPDVLRVWPDGSITPRALGSTRMFLQYGGLTADKEMRVVDEMPEFVKVTVQVKVPPSTPPYPSIYAGFELPYCGEGLYRGSAMIPHGLTFAFKVSRGFGLHEKIGTSGLNRRSFTASSEMDLFYEVEDWDV